MGKSRGERLGHGEESSGVEEVMRVEPHVVRSSGVVAQEDGVRGYSPKYWYNNGVISRQQ